MTDFFLMQRSEGTPQKKADGDDREKGHNRCKRNRLDDRN